MNRDRKRDAASWTTLPAGVREVPAPVWPLVGLSGRESELWAALWRKPIAEMWSRSDSVEQVAMYVRTFAEAEVPGASTATRTLLRQLAGELLLTIPAMLSARVRISVDELAAQRREVAPQKSSRDRMKVVPGGEG